MTQAADPRSASSFADQLLAASRLAHRRGQHEVAYHALMAAMHAAHDARDKLKLVAIEQEALEQIAWIDRHASGHRLSTASAQTHRHPGVYVMLARQATIHAQMLGRRAMAGDVSKETGT